MNETKADYLGRIVDKKHFRAFIYAPNGDSKLVETWDDFEAQISTGVWFDTKDKAEESFVSDDVKKSKKGLPAKPKKSKKEEEVDAISLGDLLSFKEV